MQTDTAGPSTSKPKGDPLVEKKDAPWVEKYRPKTLDDVAAHKEIIDTSELLVVVMSALRSCITTSGLLAQEAVCWQQQMLASKVQAQ